MVVASKWRASKEEEDWELSGDAGKNEEAKNKLPYAGTPFRFP